MGTIILVGGIGAIISAIIGTFWYSNATPMGKWHMQYLGFDKLTPEEQKALIAQAMPKMWKSYLGQFILSFLTSFFIAFVLAFTLQNGAPVGAVYMYVLFIWIAFTVPVIGQGIIWGKSEGMLSWKLFISNSLSNLVTFFVVAYVATLIIK